MPEPFTLYYYPDLLLQRGAAIVHATIPYDPIKRRHERRYRALADAKLVIERGRRYRKLLDRWSWTEGGGESPHISIHYALDGAIRCALGLPVHLRSRARPLAIGRTGIQVQARADSPLHIWTAAVSGGARRIVPEAVIDRIWADFMRGGLRSRGR